MLVALLAAVPLLRTLAIDHRPVLMSAEAGLIGSGWCGDRCAAPACTWQVPSALVLIAMAVTALEVPPDAGLLLVAGGLTARRGRTPLAGRYDRGAVHCRCRVLDLALGIGVLLLNLT